MTIVKSLEDLTRVRDEALRQHEIRTAAGSVEVVVGMGTPGIAAGARETVKAILEYIEQANLSGVVVRQTGNLGLDSWEPIVQVRLKGGEQVTYGKVTPAVARAIMQEHVAGGRVLSRYVIPR
jgi:NADP-reducing hydrogenase subunit HndB